MIRAIISLLASILTAVQAVLIYTGAQGLCLNDGCEIVDNMTKVSPLFFNITGFLYFQALFWLFLWGRYGSEYWHKLARLLLLAGLTAEAVLVFFQHSIAATFCSYCLVIFGFIVLLNLCCGLRQLLRGLVLFAAVLVACFSLQFTSPGSGKEVSLDAGSMAMLSGEKEGVRLYLFFSSTCEHCEKVIAAIDGENTCTVRFNPVDRVERFPMPEATLFQTYEPQVNRSLLQALSLKEVPVLLAITEGDSLVLKGEKRIREYLAKTCRQSPPPDYSGTSSIPSAGYSFLPDETKSIEGACAVDTDCDPPLPASGAGQNPGTSNR